MARKKIISALFSLFLVSLSVSFSSCLAPVTLTFDANGGEFSDGESVRVIKASSWAPPPLPQEPLMEGLVFVEWCLDSEGKVSAAELLSNPVTTNLTLYAKWGYSITLFSDGEQVGRIKAAAGEPINPPDIPRSGYKANWYTDVTFEEQFIFDTMPPQHIDLYARWELFNADLVFELTEDGKGYIVKRGQCLDEEIRIPAVYEGKPVTALQENAFTGEEGDPLTTIVISESVESISPDAFAYCYSLFNIEVHPDNQCFSSINGNLYSKDGTVLIYCAPSKADSCFSVPDAVTEIAEGAFYYCRELRMIVIPRGVLYISGPIVLDCPAVFAVEINADASSWNENWHGGNPAIMGCEMSGDMRRVIAFEKKEGTLINFTGSTQFGGEVIGESFLGGWYLSSDREQLFTKLFEAPEGKLYAEWKHGSSSLILEAFWRQSVDYFKEMWYENISEDCAVENVKSAVSSIYDAFVLSAPQSDFPALAFECYKGDYAKVYKYVSEYNGQTLDYIRIKGTNIYALDDYSLRYIFSKDVKKVIREDICDFFSRDGSALLKKQFDQTEGISSFEASKRIKHIGDRVFENARMENVDFNEVVSIGRRAFSGCSFSSLALGNSLKSIGDEAFADCVDLTEVAIPAGVEQIGEGAFKGCHNLMSFNVDERSWDYESIEGNLYEKGGHVLVRYAPAKQDKYFAAPYCLRKIEAYAFSDCALETAVIHKGIVEIGLHAFGDGVTIYTEALEKPLGWNNQWTGSETIIWNCKLSIDKSYVISLEKEGSVNGGNPFREGYEFGGWYSNSDYTGEKYVNTADLSSAPDGEYFAKWEMIAQNLSEKGGNIKKYLNKAFSTLLSMIEDKIFN